MNKFFILFSFLLLFISCGKEKVQEPKPENKTQEQKTDEDTATLSPQEAFSSALVNDILDVDDEDLQIYLEEEFYPQLSKLDKVTIEKISTSVYILTYFENDKEKNYLIQKWYNPVTDEIIFDKKEVQSNTRKSIK